MSWDVYLSAKHGEAVECGNYAYNVAPMYEKAGIPGGSLNDLNGISAKKMAEILAPAITYMKTYPSEMASLNPPNGWGNCIGALTFLERIYNACRKYPKRIVVVA